MNLTGESLHFTSPLTLLCRLGLTLSLLLLVGCGASRALLSAPSMAPYADLVAKPPSRSEDLTVRFLGTSTISLSDGETSIMTDAFFSRPGIRKVLFGQIAPDERRVDEALRWANVKRLEAIFVAHSHHDHAMDSALVAQKTRAVVYGSESTANIMRGSGLSEDRIHLVSDGESFSFGEFKVTVIKTPHAPGNVSPGTIDEPLPPPASAFAYKGGENYSFLIQHRHRRILVIASGNSSPGMLRGLEADVVFLGIGSLGKQAFCFVNNYWHEAVQVTGAKLVIPIHWDNFMKPLDEPLRPLPAAIDDFDRSMRLLIQFAKDRPVALRLPEPITPIDLDQR